MQMDGGLLLEKVVTFYLLMEYLFSNVLKLLILFSRVPFSILR